MKKKTLFMSCVSLLLCVAMFIGSTFAWFTDTAASGTNKIQAGNLDVELYHKDKALASTDAEKVTETVKLFDDVALWEPGAYCYETLTVKNAGTLAFKYTMSINVTNANVVNGHSLDEVLKVKVVDVAPDERPAFNGGTALKSWQLGIHNEPLYPAGTGKDSEKTFTVVVYWEPSENDDTWNMKNVNNEASLSADLGVNLVASQLMHEEDSFGKDYDNVEVATEQPSIASIFEAMSKTVENGVATDPEKLPAEIVVQSPVTLAPTPVQVGDTTENLAPEIDGATTTIVLNDTMSVGDNYVDMDQWGGLRVQGQSGRNSNVTFKGNENGKFSSVGSKVASLVYIEGNSVVTFESGTFETDCRIICYGQMGGGTSTVDVKGGTFKFSGADKDHPATFSKSGTDGLGFVAIGNDGLTINITGGKFYNCDPTGKVAAGYKVVSAVEGNDIIYTVVAE